MEGCVVAGFARSAVWSSGVFNRVCRSAVVFSRTLSGSQSGSIGGIFCCWFCGGEL